MNCAGYYVSCGVGLCLALLMYAYAVCAAPESAVASLHRPFQTPR